MKKLLLTLAGLIAAALIFTGGIYASQWLSFTGSQQAAQSESDIDDIMAILRDVHDGKITAEQAAGGLTAINEQLRIENGQLTTEMANQKQQVEDKQAEIQSKQDEINEKNKAYDTLQQERDQIATARDDAVAERDNLQSQYDNLNNGYTQIQEELSQANQYAEHLEAELHKANAAVESFSGKTSEALEEAKLYQE